MQPLTASAPASTEDLDDVLGRFHAWSNAHKASRKISEMIDGVREVSYEEALQSSRRRWQSHTTAPTSSHESSLPESPTDDKTPPNNVPFSDDTVAPDTLTLSATQDGHNNAIRAIEANAPPVFGTILREAVSPDVTSGPLALIWPAAGTPERQVSMSLRVAASEQALIKARAAEAGLSASAYLRQCALEVEKLRAQVHHTLALIEQRSEQNPQRCLAAAPPIRIAQPGFISRLRQRIFGRPDAFTIRI
jgi:hypothetical protein